jgi:hypothetical protein
MPGPCVASRAHLLGKAAGFLAPIVNSGILKTMLYELIHFGEPVRACVDGKFKE